MTDPQRPDDASGDEPTARIPAAAEPTPDAEPTPEAEPTPDAETQMLPAQPQGRRQRPGR